MGSEATLQKHIVDYLEDEGAWVCKVHQTGYGRRGIPDLVVCWRSWHISAEIKLPDEGDDAVRSEQTMELHKVRDAGGVAVVWRSVDDARMTLEILEAIEHPQPISFKLPAKRIVHVDAEVFDRPDLVDKLDPHGTTAYR